ncbi:MAG: rhomboid family intramembrane serine protease [Verrucomicrobia bacterium]|nr:rhomboid family intramembrane serine protease [Verrucomicrobiota bacterium]
MILPLSDSPNPRGVPLVTYTLIALNVAVYLLLTLPLSFQAVDLRDPSLREYLITVQRTLPRPAPIEAILSSVSSYDLFVFRHGFRPAAPQLTDLLTSIFLHGGLMHLFGNMLFLWIYGDNVEYRLGRLRFLLYYLFTGVVATVFYAFFARGSGLPLVGASGAISGVLGFYYLWFPRNRVRLFVFLFPFFMNVVQVPARWVLGFYLVIDNLLPFFLSRGTQGGGVAYGAHIGGFIAGLVVAWLMNRQEVQAAPKEYRVPPVLETPNRREQTAQALARGDVAEAAQLYFSLAPEQTRRLLAPAEALALADWLAQHGHAEAALTVYRRLLRDDPLGPGAAEAHVGAGQVQLEALGQIAPAYQHFLEALDLEPSPATSSRARAGLEAIAQLQKYPLRRFDRG